MDDDIVPPSSLRTSGVLRRALRWLGSGLAIASVTFVALRLQHDWLNLNLSQIATATWGPNVAFALIYGAANALLALAWWHLLQNFGVSLTRPGAIRIYGISQLAKYVPGNIFHLAGRQALGMTAGISATVLVKSTFWELGLLALAGSLSACLILPLLTPAVSTSTSLFLFVAAAALIVSLLKNRAGVQPARALIWQIVFLFISGTLFVALLNLLVESEGGLSWQQSIAIGGAYIAAWLIGLVTPGAPAGVGVREMVLFILLKDYGNESSLLTAVVLSRLVTVAGDLIFFFASSALPAPIYRGKATDGKT